MSIYVYNESFVLCACLMKVMFFKKHVVHVKLEIHVVIVSRQI